MAFRPPSVLTAGDIVIDQHIYRGERVTLHDRPRYGTSAFPEPGGAALTHRMIEALLAADLKERTDLWERDGRRGAKPESARCKLVCEPPTLDDPDWPQRLVGWASWAPFPKAGTNNLYWRCSAQFGYGTQSTDDKRFLHRAKDAPRHPDILVLDDAGDDFRRRKHEDLWQLSPRKTRLPRWILLKLAGPIGKGDLWHRLMNCEPRKRLVVLVSADLLRQGNIRLSRGLSWERTAEHLCTGFTHNPILQPLRRARHVIVNFNGDGAMWIDFSGRAPRARLIFDPACAEGERVGRIPGTVFGYQTCLTAAITLTLARHETRSDPDFRPAIERGLSATRNLSAEGHGLAVSDKGEYHAASGFPTERLAKEILGPSQRYAVSDVPWRPANSGDGRARPWSILGALQHPAAAAEPLYGYARQLLIRGESILEHVPHLRLRKLLTADRTEIESLRSLRRILEAYRDTGSSKKPLCIGVFGSPGSGKSFGVEQLAQAVFGDPDKDGYKGWKEFNLAQFDSEIVCCSSDGIVG